MIIMMIERVKNEIKRHGGKVEHSEGYDGYHSYSIPLSEVEWFGAWRWNVPFQVLCHGEGPQSEQESKRRLHFGVWYHVSLGMTCPHCGEGFTGGGGKNV